MSYNYSSSGNDVSKMTKEKSVVVHVEEPVAQSPTSTVGGMGDLETVSTGREVLKEQSGHRPRLDLGDVNGGENGESERAGWTLKALPSPPLLRSSSYSDLKASIVGEEQYPRKRRLKGPLPTFEGLGLSFFNRAHSTHHWHIDRCLSSPTINQVFRPLSSPSFASGYLLTPPEEIDSMKWSNSLSLKAAQPTDQGPQNHPDDRVQERVQTMSMDEPSSTTHHSSSEQHNSVGPGLASSVMTVPSRIKADEDLQMGLDQAINATGILAPFQLVFGHSNNTV